MKNEYVNTEIEEKVLKPLNGMAMLLVLILVLLASVAAMVFGIMQEMAVLITVSVIVFCIICVLFAGLKVINPNEALVLTLFGKYYGTIKSHGFFFVNPFTTGRNPVAEKQGAPEGFLEELNESNKKNGKGKKQPVSKKVSTKVLTFNNGTQKVNDAMGNPIIIGAIVVWKVVNPTKAVFNVDDYFQYLSTQCDSTIRNIARLYPYDNMEDTDTDEKTLRGSSQEIAETMKGKLQQRVEDAGLEVLEVRITHLSYAEEIAAAMLQRQQASAIIAARQKIVTGAVGMVKSALDQLGEEDIVVLDEERKAAMVSNLLVVLCGNKEAQPIVNSGTIY
ncbi:SPFH domain-containing protein [Anaerovorax odorimutans]|uniref:SPFH domain-containing protein n=1 Tax=Anaerovorax odorimutans TaxID=109327 RepID=A0ABT1RKJ2_9FIRM|nr:SPFH domain-containing protein [Anaerovorax odorimutans]MCQ4635706.1 SPFH domain-containing protein [Anaerovorax odorimutans]